MSIVGFFAPIERTASAATQLTLSMSAATGSNGAPVTVTVTPNGVMAATVNVILSVSGGGTLGLPGFTFSAGTSGAQSTTLTRTVDGTSTLTMTNDGGLGNAGTPASFTSLSTNVRTALMGDSLTTHLLGYNWSPVFWFNGLNGGPLQVVANAGIAGNTVADMLARVDNAYTAATPGLAGLGALGRIVFRGGTNDARAGQSWAGISSNASALLTKLKSYCSGKVIVLSVPPVGPTEANYATINALTQTYNTGYAALAAADPTRLLFVDDSANLRDGTGAQLSGYFQSDGIHNDGRATWKEGVDAAAALATELSGYASPLSTNSADVYPSQPQWNDNHVNAGTGGSVGGGFTGTLPNGYGVGGYGSGFAGTASIVAADVGDANATPWIRVAPTQVGYTGSGEAIVITKPLSGRSVTTVDPASLDVMVEVRFNAFDTRPFKWARLMVMGSTTSQPFTYDIDLKMGGESAISHSSVVARLAMPRQASTAESGLSIRWEWATRFAYTGSMGSFDFRCLTVRG